MNSLLFCEAFGSREFIPTFATGVTLTYDLEKRSRHGLRDFFVSACMCLFSVLSGFQVKEFTLAIDICVAIMCDLDTHGYALIYVT